MSAAQGDVGAEGLDLDEVRAVAGMSRVVNATEAALLACEVLRLLALLAPVQEAARELDATIRRLERGRDLLLLDAPLSALADAALATIADEKDGAP